MATLKPNDFIKTVFIDEVSKLINDHPYISFMVMGVGIEFLGKSIDKNLTNWDTPNRSRKDFNDAIKNIPSLQKYQPFIDTHDIYSSLRCGLLHSAVPGHSITLSSKGEAPHLLQDNGRLNLKVEEFYADFRAACELVINDTYPANNKMEKPFIQVPGNTFNAGTYLSTGSTQSIQITVTNTTSGM
jgi:cytoskeletal protein RodZ